MTMMMKRTVSINPHAIARRACVLMLLALVFASAGAPAQSLRERFRERQQQRNADGATLPAPGGMRVQRDMAYGPDPAQRFDVYLPPAARDAMVILMVHGGAWTTGDKTSGAVIDNKIAHWLPTGAIVVSANNRLLPAADAREQMRDIARALAKVQALAPAWGGDPSRVLLMGHSAGAHLVALLGASPAAVAAAGARPPIGIVALDSAAMDVETIMQSPTHMAFYDSAFGSDPAGWTAASPLRQLRRGAPPVMAVCSTRRADSCAAARDFVDRARSLGVRAVVSPQDLSHRQINQTLGLPSAYTDGVDAFIASLPR